MIMAITIVKALFYVRLYFPSFGAYITAVDKSCDVTYHYGTIRPHMA